MKTLIVGDSISAGYGFPLEIREPNIWPNKLGASLGFDINNQSVPGYDNSGIFINLMSNIYQDKYDLVLVQISSLPRVLVSPNMHGCINLGHIDGYELYAALSKVHSIEFSIDDCKAFVKMFHQINGFYEHWNRLIKIILALQDLRDRGHNIKIINGGLFWPEELFLSNTTKYAKELLNYHSLPDSDIEQGLATIGKQVKNIDLSMWINPFNNLYEMKVDCAPLDNHPGIQSHALYTNMLLQSLTSSV